MHGAKRVARGQPSLVERWSVRSSAGIAGVPLARKTDLLPGEDGIGGRNSRRSGICCAATRLTIRDEIITAPPASVLPVLLGFAGEATRFDLSGRWSSLRRALGISGGSGSTLRATFSMARATFIIDRSRRDGKSGVALGEL